MGKQKRTEENEMSAIMAEIRAGQKQNMEAKSRVVETQNAEAQVEAVEAIKAPKEEIIEEPEKVETPLETIARKQPEEMKCLVVPNEAAELYNLIKVGYPKAEIRIMYADWKQKKFDAIWKRAVEMVKSSQVEKEDARAEVVMRLQDLYTKNYKSGNLKECRNVIDSLCNVLGLNKSDINVNAVFETAWK